MGMFSIDENPAYIELEKKYNTCKWQITDLMRQVNELTERNDKLCERNLDLENEVEHLQSVNRVIYQELARMANECYNHLKN